MNTDEIAKYAGLYAMKNPATAVAVALAESGGNETATHTNTNGTTDTGLWQINSVHKQSHPEWTVAWLKDPQHNAEAMSVISSNGTNWQPWTTFRTGAYRAHMAEAERAVDNTSGSGGLGSIPNPLDAVDDVAGAIGNVGQALSGLVTFITDPNTWRRIALAGIGTAIVVVSVAIIARGTEAGQAVESTVGKAAKQGKKAAAIAAAV